MAQLATCPHCASDFLLPAFDRGVTRGACPDCGGVFGLEEIGRRELAEARPVDTAEEEDNRPVTRQTLPSFSGTTLASFLKEAEQRNRQRNDAPREEEPNQTFDLEGDPYGLRAGDTVVGPDLFRAADDEAPTQPSRQTFHLQEGGGDYGERESAEPYESDLTRLTTPDSAEGLMAHFPEKPDDVPGLEEGDDFQSAFTVPEIEGIESDVLPVEWSSPSTAATNQEVAGEDMPSVNERHSAGKVAVRRRSSGSPWGFLLKVGVSGVVGVVGGYLIVLWILQWRGLTEDPMGLAQYYPNAVLPATFQHGAKKQPISASRPNDSPAREHEKSEEPEEPELVVPAAHDDGQFALAEPLAEPAAIVPELHGVPQFNLDDLEKATTEAAAQAPGLVNGDFAQSETRKVKGAAYAKLAHLAQVIACLDPAVAGHALMEPAQQVFPPLFTDPRQRAENSLIAEKWIASGNRRHGGIFFCGQPDEGLQQGSVVEYQVQLPSGTSLAVLTPEKLDVDEFRQAVSAGVVGYLLDDAKKQVEGYSGQTTEAVWGAYLFPIGP